MLSGVQISYCLMDCYPFLSMNLIANRSTAGFVRSGPSDRGVPAMKPRAAHEQANSDSGRNRASSINPARNFSKDSNRQENQPGDYKEITETCFAEYFYPFAHA